MTSTVILFNAKDPQQPAFEIRVRAAKHEPDMFYVNRCMHLMENHLLADRDPDMVGSPAN